MPHHVAILGLGLMGQRMLRTMRDHPGFTVTAGYDPQPDHAAITDAHGGALPLVDDPAAILDDGAFDVIYIASPPAHHLPQAQRAIARGIPVFCEKPLATDRADADVVIADAAARGVPTAVNFPLATLDGVAMIEDEIARGAAGAPVRIDILFHFSAWPRTWHTAGAWLDGDAEGGFLREVFSHFAYLTQRVAGPLTPVAAHRADAPDGGTERHVVARFDAGGIPVTLIAGAGGAAPDRNEWTWYGTAASFQLRDWRDLFVSRGGAAWTPVPPTTDRAGGLLQLDQLDALLTGRPHVLPDFAAAADVLSAVEGVRERSSSA